MPKWKVTYRDESGGWQEDRYPNEGLASNEAKKLLDAGHSAVTVSECDPDD